MQSPRLDELAAFATIAKYKSFQKAATDLGVSPSALSHTMRHLEDRLSIRLLHRTTRHVSVTEAGRRLLERIAPAFADITLAVDELNMLREAPIGTIRLNTPHQAARLVLIPILRQFMAQYPQIEIEIVADDHVVDIAADGFDAGVRFGETLAPDMIALALGPAQRFIVVGTPSYFEGRTLPVTPADLREHHCIRYRFPSGRPYRWEFERGGQSLDIEVQGHLTLEDNDLVVDAVRNGIGLGYVYEAQVRAEIESGTLMPVLGDWCPVIPGFFLYYPSRRNPSFAFRALLDFIRTTV